MNTLIALISTTLSIFAVSSASAQALYWDPGQSSSATAGGGGNWDTSSTFWFNGTSDVPWSSGDDAWFEGTAGTVTLMQNTSAADLYFTNTTGNYYITNATSTEVLSVANTIDTGGGEHTIAALLSNSGTLNKNGAGRLHLPVDNTAGLTGSVMINQGSLSAETNNALGANNTITVADGAAVEFNGVISNNNYGFNNFVVNGTGITNSGSIRNVSGQTISYGTITVAENNSLIYADSGSFVSYGGVSSGGNNYNLYIGGPGAVQIESGSFNIGTGTVVVQAPSTFDMYSAPSSVNFGSVLVEKGATFGFDQDGDFGPIPSSQDTTNVILDGGTVSSTGNDTMNGARGITITTNGGALSDTSGIWATCNIYGSNAPVTFGGSGNIRPGGAASTNIVNLGTGTLIKVGSDDVNTTYASSFIFSNMVLNGGSLTFNYDQSSGQKSTLGAIPSSFCPSNIWLSGGALHAGHSTTINPVRGIYVASSGTVADTVSSGGTVTLGSVISGPGNMIFPNGNAAKITAIILSANNSYTGTTTIGNSNAVTVGTGSTSGTLGTGNTVDNWTLTFNRTGSYAYAGNISSTGAVINAGSGVVALGGINTYSGVTTVSAGTLLIDGTNGASAITVNGGNLGGTGLINGPITVNASGTLALGSGSLSVSNNVSIAGNVSAFLNTSLTPSSGTAITSGTLGNTGTGTILVTNLGPALTAGDTFQLFSQPVSGGNKMFISGAGVEWANNLAANGSISVVGSLPQPVVNSVSLVGTNLVMSGTNGYTGGRYSVLATTNVALPLSSWKPVWTNSFGSGGVFSVTNPVVPGTPSECYTLKLQ
jgi:fibronectin-binding autotransporter adhesin